MIKIKVSVVILILINVTIAGIISYPKNEKVNDDILHSTNDETLIVEYSKNKQRNNIKYENHTSKNGVSDHQDDDIRIQEVADGKDTVNSKTHIHGDGLEIFINNVRPKRDIEETNICTILKNNTKSVRKQGKLKIYIEDKPKEIVVMSSKRPTGQALAALIAAAIRLKAGYEDSVTRTIDDRTVSELAATVPVLTSTEFEDSKVYIHVDADMEESENEPAILNCPRYSQSCSMAGSRLQDIGTTPSARVLVYAVCSSKSLKMRQCVDVSPSLFYQNRATFELHGFIQPGESCIPVYVMPDVYPELDLRGKSLSHELPFCLNARIERNQVIGEIRNSHIPFIFIDYDLGYKKTEVNVQEILLSPELFPHTKTVTYRLADLFLFQKYAPKIADILNTTMPKPEDLREVLELNTSIKNIDEAACAWSNKNLGKFNKWTQTTDRWLYFFAVICKGKFETEYREIIKKLESSSFLRNNITLFKYNLYTRTIDCNKPNTLNVKFVGFTRRADSVDWGGVIAPAAGAKVVSDTASQKNIPQLIFYDVPPTGTILKMVTSTISGELSLLVRSYLNYFKKCDWQRIAVISEYTDVAGSITKELRSGIVLKEKNITRSSNISEIITDLRNENARVFFLNVGYETANIIVCEAAKLEGMKDETQYAWIAREWYPTNETCGKDVKILTMTYWWQGGNETLIKDLGGSADIRSIINRNSPWPVLAAPLVDAFITMIFRIERVLRDHPEFTYNVRHPNFSRLISEIRKEPIPGVVQNIIQKNFTQHNPLIFIYEWRNFTNKLTGLWRAQSDDNTFISLTNQHVYGDLVPHDGRSYCTTTTSGDEFNPVCHTVIWALSPVILVVFVVALVWLYHVRLVESKKREREFLVRLLSRCKRTASLLKAYLVDRSDLELLKELGHGQFGRVRFGMLRVCNRMPTPVAAKSLRVDAAPAEEAEFLREGSAMASLSHDHIVRLVGVIADAEGPSLLLMEHAFYGDLLKYLRERRHLAEIFERDLKFSQGSGDVPLQVSDDPQSPHPEACYVSPLELTRLAREAADAVDYLCTNHFLHRDIRAANCLVDDRRCLKLADFGMARNVDAKDRFPDDSEESEDYKYICRRRGIFPVPWMAPESLVRGEFSRATDIWALGVLLLEIATLGARPYGSWLPEQIFRFVLNGGRPALPIDVSYHTCEITEKCWAEDPTERPTAKEVHTYLKDNPTAIRAALRPAWPELDTACAPQSSDSGFGERMSEDWSKGVDLRVSTL